MADDSDYYGRHVAEYGDYKSDSYDSDEAPYAPLAPDLVGQSPAQSWKNAEAKPTRFSGNTEEATGSNLREASVIGASPTPERPGKGNDPYTIPSYYGVAGASRTSLTTEVEDIMGYAPTRDSFYSRSLGAVQKVASGVSSLGGRVGDVFSRLRDRAGDVFSRGRGGS